MDDKNGVPLLFEGGQEGAQIEWTEQTRRRQQRVEVPPLKRHFADGEPMLLEQALQLSQMLNACKQGMPVCLHFCIIGCCKLSNVA